MAHELDKQFLQAVTEFVELQNAQDLQGILRLMHQESFAYKPMQQVLLKLFTAFELQTTLLDKVFVTTEHEYAYVRTKLKTEKIAGPDFKNNITEFLVVFRNIGNTWKIWCRHPLSFHLLEPEGNVRANCPNFN